MKVIQAVSSVGQSQSCVVLLGDLGTGSDRLPALAPFISSACLKRFSFGCCGCCWFQPSSSWLRNMLPSPPSWDTAEPQRWSQPGWRASPAAWDTAFPSERRCLLRARPLPKLPCCTDFKLGLSSFFQTLPCSLPQLWFPAMQPCLLSAFHGVKHKKLTTWHFFPATL